MKFKYFDAVDGKNMTKEQFKLAERYKPFRKLSLQVIFINIKQ